MVRIILTKQGNIKDQLELHIDVYETITAKKWMNLLKQILHKNEPIKKHVSCHGWIMDQSRTLKHIVDEINYTVNQVNKYNFAKAAWEEKRTDIKKDFKVDLDLTVQSLVQGKQFNTDIVNQLHKHTNRISHREIRFYILDLKIHEKRQEKATKETPNHSDF